MCVFEDVSIKEKSVTEGKYSYSYFGCPAKNVPTKVETKPSALPTAMHL